MSLDGCGKFLKYSIFIVNFLIFTVGMVIVGLGIWALADGSNMNKVLGDNTYAASSAILLTFGGVVAFISFLGCCGALKEVKCLLLTFFIILLIVSILIVVGVVFAFKIKDEVDQAFMDGLRETMKEYKRKEPIKEAWDNVQRKLKCCGAAAPQDWTPYTGAFPESCECDSGEDRCGTTVHDKTYWDDGCGTRLKEEIKKHATPLLAVGITIIVVMLLSMVFSCSLFLML